MEYLEDFEVGEVIIFKPYNNEVKARIKRKGSLGELGKMQLDPNDERMFYELETIDRIRNHVFSVTTALSIYKV